MGSINKLLLTTQVFTTWIRGGRKFERRDEATLRNDIWLDPVTLVALKRRWDGRARAKNRIGGEYGVYICVPDGRLALHGGEAGSKKETCRTHLKRGKKHGTNSAKARHQHGPGATEGTGKVRRPASLHCIPLLNLRTTAVSRTTERG